MKDYVSVIYDETRTPRTSYPFQLTEYLASRFDIRKGSTLLEIGCGRGDFLCAFQSIGCVCMGVDLSESSINQIGNIQVKKVDISKETLPFDNESLDVVYHKSLIEHLYTPDHLMRETYRILKPGGRVIILTPDWVSQMRVFYEDFTHSRPYDRQAIHDLLTVYHFSQIEVELFYQLPIIWRYPSLRVSSKFLQLIMSTPTARYITTKTGIKFFRWSVELMILGTGRKEATSEY